MKKEYVAIFTTVDQLTPDPTTWETRPRAIKVEEHTTVSEMVALYERIHGKYKTFSIKIVQLEEL